MRDDASGISTPRPTLTELALAAGVSLSTASRAMAGRGDLAEATRARVLRAADQLGYRKRSRQGRPALGDLRLIELVVGGISGGWSEAIIIGAQREAFRLGFDLVLTMEREDPEDDWPRRVARRHPAGVLLASITPTRAQLETLTLARIPLVLLDPQSPPLSPIASVGTTDRLGGYQAGEHLVATGLRRFAMVTGRPQYRFGKEREAGFSEALRDAGLPESASQLISFSSDAELDVALAALAAVSPLPFGVLTRDDAMAFAVYRSARRLGIAIPTRMSVVGFNDIALAAGARPSLTTVHQPVEDIAARAVQLVRELADGGGGAAPTRVELPTRLVVRRSTLPLPPAGGPRVP